MAEKWKKLTFWLVYFQKIFEYNHIYMRMLHFVKDECV